MWVVGNPLRKSGRRRDVSEEQTQQHSSPLQTERGSTRIEDSVVTKIAGIAAQEVEGVQMGGGTARAVGGSWIA
jgi:hypothetical protein